MTALTELRRRQRELLEELARKGLEGAGDIPKRIKALEHEITAAMEVVPEHVAEWPLSHEDIEKWVESRPWVFAATLASNPHEYALKRAGDGAMFERVLLHIREFGYRNVYGGQEYGQYDAAGYFLWSMGNGLETSKLINRKPLSLGERRSPACRWKPTKATRARVALDRLVVGDALELKEGKVRVERLEDAGDQERYGVTSGKRHTDMGRDAALKRLSGYTLAQLGEMRYVDSGTRSTLRVEQGRLL